jgi:serine protease inhibitor ecotin
VDHNRDLERLHYWGHSVGAACGRTWLKETVAFEHRSLKMAEAPISKKRKRGNPNQMTGLIGVSKHRKKYKASITYGGTKKNLGTFDTKEQAGIAYDRFVIDKSTEEVFFILNYPKMSDQKREEVLKVEPVQQKRGTPNQMTGLIGVSKSGKKKYKTTIYFDGRNYNLGSFDTKEEAGIAYDRFVVDKSTEKVFFTLNYPKMSDAEREEALKVEKPVQQKRGTPNQTTGLIGVSNAAGEKYKAQIVIDGTLHYLGSFDTKVQAGIAYDRFVVDKSTEEVSFILNYPNMSDAEREEALKVEEPVQEKRGNPNQTTGLIGVYKSGKKYTAGITYGGTKHHLGTFDTKEQAGMAYDRAAIIINKSTEEVSFTLNYPKMSDREREVALAAEPPHKKHKRGTTRSEEESDDGSSSSSSSSDSCHSSDDDESDDEKAVEPTPSPQAPPIFERDPMLDQLFADAQHKKQQQREY